MKTKLLKLALFAVASVLPLGASAATETYNFTGFTNNTTTTAGTESKGKVNNVSINLLQLGGETFNNRFAVSRVGGNAGSAWVVKNYNDQKGLYTVYNDRYFTILNLNDGDQITITWTTDGDGTLKFYDAPAIAGKSASDAVESGTIYTISTSEASVNVNLFADGSGDNTKLYIKSVVIEDPVSSVPVTVGVTGYSNTYNFKDTETLAFDNTDSNSSKNREMFGGKFCVNSKGIDKDIQLTEEYGFKILYANKPFTIEDLKKGEKITISFTNGNSDTGFSVSGTSILEGVDGGAAIASGTEYTILDNGNLVLNNSTKNPTIQSITISREEQNIGGATLVSENALDFTDVTEIEAYVATAASAGTVTFNRVYKVAAGTPIYLKADAAVSVDVPVLVGDPEIISTNLLTGSASATTPLTSTEDIKYYVFGVLNGVAGFYPVSTEGTLTSAAGKAYLELTAAQASLARSIRMVFDDVTGINTVKENNGNETGDNIWYTLQGARVAKPTHGIYIRNGKKIFIK